MGSRWRKLSVTTRGRGCGELGWVVVGGNWQLLPGGGSVASWDG